MDEGLTIDEASENVIRTAPVEIEGSAQVRYRASILNERVVLSGTVRNVVGEAVAGAGPTEFELHSAMMDEPLRSAWLRLERIAESLE